MQEFSKLSGLIENKKFCPICNNILKCKIISSNIFLNIEKVFDNIASDKKISKIEIEFNVGDTNIAMKELGIIINLDENYILADKSENIPDILN